MRILLASMLSLLFVTSAVAADFTLTSTAFADHGKIPALYSCDGNDISPPLHWENAPKNTESFALILTVPDSTSGIEYKWVVYNIPATIKDLAQGASHNLPDDASMGMNSYHDAIYRGPCPPDSKLHEYVFTLYALDSSINLLENAEAEDVIEEIRHHVLKQAQLTGFFKH